MLLECGSGLASRNGIEIEWSRNGSRVQSGMDVSGGREGGEMRRKEGREGGRNEEKGREGGREERGREGRGRREVEGGDERAK